MPRSSAMGKTRRGRMGGFGQGAGHGGECICPECGTTAFHKAGTPCYFMKCPKCSAIMIRNRSGQERSTREIIIKEMNDNGF